MDVFPPLTPASWPQYELLDFGAGLRLERWGERVLIRPDINAFGRPSLGEEVWRTAVAEFKEKSRGEGKWVWLADPNHNLLSNPWIVSWEGLQFELRHTPQKHVGLFPEQFPQWQWLANIASVENKRREQPIKVLNLFAYTGAASLALGKVGAAVTHIEASKSTLTWARRNQELSGELNAKIRWIPEDTPTFVARELERGNRYDLILLDPPAHGLGPKGEHWQFDKSIGSLLENCRDLLNPNPVGLLLNVYTSALSARGWSLRLSEIMANKGGQVAVSSVGIQAAQSKHLLSTGLAVLWVADNLNL